MTKLEKLEELKAEVEAASEACEVAYTVWDKAHTAYAGAEAYLNATYAAYADAQNALQDELKKAEGQTNE